MLGVRMVMGGGCRRVDGTTTALFTTRVVRGPGAVLKVTAKSAPINLCGRLIGVCRTKSLSFSRIAAFGLSRCVKLTPRRSRDCRCFVGSGLFSRMGVGGRGMRMPSKIKFRTKRTKGTCRRLVTGAKRMRVRLLKLKYGKRVKFGRPTSRFAGMANRVSLASDAVRTGGHFFRGGRSIPEGTISVKVKAVVHTGGVMLLMGKRGGTRVLGRMMGKPIAPGMPKDVLRFRPRMAIVYSRRTTGCLWGTYGESLASVQLALGDDLYPRELLDGQWRP